MRVDKWLWTARLFKTRSLAAQAVKAGRVSVGGVAVKPGRELRPGDELEVNMGQLRRVVIVLGAAERRVPAAETSRLYRETDESLAAAQRHAELRRLAAPLDLGGRPTKRDRRRYEAVRRQPLADKDDAPRGAD